MNTSICLAMSPALRAGPFIYHATPEDLLRACRHVAGLGYRGVTVLPEVDTPGLAERLNMALSETGLKLAAVGTGAGASRGLTLTNVDESARRGAIEFIRRCMSLASNAANGNGAIIIGSMQGRITADVERSRAMLWLRSGVEELARFGREVGCRVLLEPLNRYETNVFNTLDDAARLIDDIGESNVAILADLFHMNIEEECLATSIRQAGRRVGHVHIADSNRRPAGNGHIDYTNVAESLADIGYDGYLEVEAFPWPNPDQAARQSLEMIQRTFKSTTNATR